MCKNELHSTVIHVKMAQPQTRQQPQDSFLVFRKGDQIVVLGLMNHSVIGGVLFKNYLEGWIVIMSDVER